MDFEAAAEHTTFPMNPAVPPHAYLWCVLMLRCGDPAQNKLPQQQRRGELLQKFLLWNGNVKKQRFPFISHRIDQHRRKRLEIETEPVDKSSFLSVCLCVWRGVISFTQEVISHFGLVASEDKTSEERSPEWRRKNAFLYAAWQVGEVCRVLSSVCGTGAWIGGPHWDVPPSVRVFGGTCGLRSSEKRPNSRHDPGVDSSTVSPQKMSFCIFWLLWILDLLRFFIYWLLVIIVRA